MKKYLLIIMFLFLGFVSSCTMPEQNQGNNNGAINYTYYIVGFDSNYGSYVAPQSIKSGDCILKPQDPTKDNFQFLCWTFNGIEYDFNTPVINDVTLIAVWKEIGVHTHFYTANIVNPTCVAKGYTEYICECGDSYQEDFVDTVEHDLYTANHRSPTTTSEGYGDVQSCVNCDYVYYSDFVFSNTHENLEYMNLMDNNILILVHILSLMYTMFL